MFCENSMSKFDAQAFCAKIEKDKERVDIYTFFNYLVTKNQDCVTFFSKNDKEAQMCYRNENFNIKFSMKFDTLEDQKFIKFEIIEDCDVSKELYNLYKLFEDMCKHFDTMTS